MLQQTHAGSHEQLLQSACCAHTRSVYAHTYMPVVHRTAPLHVSFRVPHALQMLWDHYKETLRWRILYLAWTRKGDAGHTVLVTDIPGNPSGTIFGRINDVCLLLCAAV